MARKYNRKVKKKNKKPSEEGLRGIIASLQHLEQAFLINNPRNRTMFQYLRSLFLPHDENRYTANEQFQYPLYDPEPIKAVDRAVSGYQSYHISPNDTYFELDAYNDILESKDESDIDLEKALEKRTKDIHKIKQEPHNYSVMTRNIRDKLVFNVSGRTIDAHDISVARFTYYAPEEIALASSNGRQHDLFGVRTFLTPFQINFQFKKRMTKFRDYASSVNDVVQKDNFGRFSEGQNEAVNRFNIPLPVLREYLMIEAAPKGGTYVEAIERLLPVQKDEEKLWVDIWFTKEDIFKMEINPYRKIIISKMFPEHTPTGLGKGTGEKALALAIELNEVAQTNLTAYERTYGPSYSAFGEEDALNVRLNKDHVNYISEGTKPVTANSLNANIDGMVNYFNHLAAKVQRMFDLDVFELINKSRMPSGEVDVRKSDDYRKLGLYLSQDNTDDLNPTVLAINNIIHAYIVAHKQQDRLSGRVLNARYTSALAMSHKNSSIDNLNQVMRSVLAAKQIEQNPSPLDDEFDLAPMMKEIFLKTSAQKVVLDEEETRKKKQQREDDMEVQRTKSEAEALGELSRAARESEEAQAGPEGRANTVGGGTPGRPGEVAA